MHEEVIQDFKTGDLIVASRVGLFPSLVKITSDSETSNVRIFPNSLSQHQFLILSFFLKQVAMILKTPNRWTRKVELFLVELGRNYERMVCSFSEQYGPRPGLNVFRLEESNPIKTLFFS